MKVIDLCSGLGGATQYFMDKGHQVFTVDINPKFRADLIQDVRRLQISAFPYKPDFVWASPPCIEFTKWNMPWYRNSQTPDMSIVKACIRLINELKPAYWILENVKGSVPFIKQLLGEPKKMVAYHYLWGDFPIFHCKSKKRKQKISGSTPELRSLIPYELSKALGMAIEREIGNGYPLGYKPNSL